MESRIEHCDLTEKNNTFERCPATITVKVIIALFANPTVHTGINRVAFSGTPDAHPVDPVGLAILVRLDSLALIKEKKNCENHEIYNWTLPFDEKKKHLQVNVDTVENKGSHAAHKAIWWILICTNEKTRSQKHWTNWSSTLFWLALSGTVYDHHWLFSIFFHQNRVPCVIVQSEIKWWKS